MLASFLPTTLTALLALQQAAAHVDARAACDVLALELRTRAERDVAALAHVGAAAHAARTSDAPSALAAETIGDSFASWFGDAWEYQHAYFPYIGAQAAELAHARAPAFATTEDVRAAIFETLGDSYELTSTWMWSDPNNGSYLHAATTGGATAAIDSLVLLPWTFPAVDLSALPAFAQTALAPANHAQNTAFFYSCRLDGELDHSGVAVFNGDPNEPRLVLWPDTLIEPGAVFTSVEIALVRQLDVLVGGLDWPLLVALVRPAFQPPHWSYVPGGGGAAHLTDPCDVWECLLSAASQYEAELAAAGQEYKNSVDAAMANFMAALDASIEYEKSIKAMFAQVGENGMVGGAGAAVWRDIFQNQVDDADSQYDAAVANAKAALKTRVCNAIKQLRDRVADCIEDCPDLAPLNDKLAAYFANSGC